MRLFKHARNVKSTAIACLMAAMLTMGGIPAVALAQPDAVTPAAEAAAEEGVAPATPAAGDAAAPSEADDDAPGGTTAGAPEEGAATPAAPEADDADNALLAEEDDADDADDSADEPDAIEPYEPTPGRTIDDGIYEVVFNVSSHTVLDVAGGSKAWGGNVQTWSANGLAPQKWKITCDDQGYYTFINVNSGLALDLAGGGMSNGTNIRQWQVNGYPAQQWIIEQNDDGTYSIYSRWSKNAIDVSGGSSTPGTNVQSWRANHSDGQKVTFRQTPVLADGVYTIQSALNTNLRVAVGANNNVQLTTAGGDQSQKWMVTRGEDGYYTLECIKYGFRLDVAGASKQAGANVRQWVISNGDAQKWELRPAGNGGFTLVSKWSGMALDVSGGIGANGRNIQQWHPNNANPQIFYFTTTPLVSAGDYNIASAIDSNFVFDAAGANKNNGCNLHLYKNIKGYAQCVRVSINADGTYKFKFPFSNKVIEVTKGLSANGTNIQLWEDNGAACQKWIISYAGGGSFTFKNALTGKMMDACGNRAANGVNIQQYQANGIKGQSFKFQPTTYVPPQPASWTAMDNRANVTSSATGWLILCDYTNCLVGVYKGSVGNWTRYAMWACSPGAYYSPTVRGTFNVTGKLYAFGYGKGYTCYYATQFYGDYLFHSILYNEGTWNVQDGRLGMHLSHGCIRLATANAKYLYDNCPYGTRVVVY